MNEKKIKQIVKENYGKIAETEICCGSCNCNSMDNSELAKTLGYSDEEIKNVPEANLGLGCGNPTALGEIKEGDVVLDLGSGAGFDAFLASKRVGENGKVIGVDMTPEMIKKATDNTKKYNYKNVEFKLGDIEELPIQDNVIDVIISNCVINLAPDKDKVFSEVHRVLKKGGKIFVSDIVLTGELTKEQKNDEELLAGCVGGALQKGDYINKIKNAGFEVKVLGEDKDISQRQYAGLPLESLKVEAIKELANEY